MNKIYFVGGLIIIAIMGFGIGFWGRGMVLAQNYNPNLSVQKLQFMQSLSANSFGNNGGGGSCGN